MNSVSAIGMHDAPISTRMLSAYLPKKSVERKSFAPVFVNNISGLAFSAPIFRGKMLALKKPLKSRVCLSTAFRP